MIQSLSGWHVGMWRSALVLEGQPGDEEPSQLSAPEVWQAQPLFPTSLAVTLTSLSQAHTSCMVGG